MMKMMNLRAWLFHRKQFENPEKLVLLLNVHYLSSSKPLVSVSITSRVYSLTLTLDDNNNESLQMKVARLEKENNKLKRKGLKKKGMCFLTCISVAEIFKDINSGK
jgi:hypothetical protein